MKKFKKILLLLGFLFLLSGCVKLDVSIEVDSKQNATVSGTFLIQREILKAQGKSIDELVKELPKDVQEAIGTYEVIEKVVDDIIYDGIVVNQLSIVGQNYLHTEIKEDTMMLTIEEATLDKLGFNLNALEGEMGSVEILKNLGLEMKLTIKMPGKIKSSTAGEISYRTATIDLSDNLNQTIVIESDTYAYLLWIVAGVVTIAILIVLIVLVLINKRKKSDRICGRNEITDILNMEHKHKK